MDLKRSISLLLVCLLLLGVLSACSLSDLRRRAGLSGSSVESEKLPEGEKPELVYPKGSKNGSVRPVIYRITGKNGQECWLFGTIHVGDDRMDRVMETLEPVLDSCTSLVVEADVVAYNDASGFNLERTSDAAKFLARPGRTAKELMPEELYRSSADILKSAGVRNYDLYNLAWWSSALSDAATIAGKRLSKDKGADWAILEYWHDTAYPGVVHELEGAEDQINRLLSLSDEMNLMLIRSVADRFDDCVAQRQRLYDVWISGDEQSLMAEVFGEDRDLSGVSQRDRELAAQYNKVMLDDRNANMCAGIIDCMALGGRPFVAVGIGHLLGDNGLVALLRAKGFKVERVRY